MTNPEVSPAETPPLTKTDLEGSKWRLVLSTATHDTYTRISHTVTAEGRSGSVGAEFLPREQVEQEQAALRPCFREARVAGTAA